MSTSAQRRAYGIAAILLAEASVEGIVEASIRVHDTDEVATTLQTFRELIVELKDRADMIEIENKVV
jgi:hypothetical protein